MEKKQDLDSQSNGPTELQPPSAMPQSPQNQAQSSAPRPPRNMSQLSWICVVTSLLASMFLFTLDNTVVADAQPKIIDRFGNVGLLPWVSVAYALGAIALNLFLYEYYDPISPVFQNRLDSQCAGAICSLNSTTSCFSLSGLYYLMSDPPSAVLLLQ